MQGKVLSGYGVLSILYFTYVKNRVPALRKKMQFGEMNKVLVVGRQFLF